MLHDHGLEGSVWGGAGRQAASGTPAFAVLFIGSGVRNTDGSRR